MYDINRIIYMGRELEASDIHISAGQPLLIRRYGKLEEAPLQPTEAETEEMLYGLLDGRQNEWLKEGKDIDFAVQTQDGNRQRINVFRQQNRIAAAIRLLSSHIPSLKELHLPEKLYELAAEPRGLVLVTGPTGSGKSTTLASMIEYINQNQAVHIITIEDPIEYTYEGKKALIHQRETGRDTAGFASALRSALREDPDIILVGEMRDFETIQAALTAAETGHLVLSTLHTTGAAQTIDRIIDACPAGSQNQVRTQLAGVLKGVITQCLMPMAGGRGRIAGTEVLLGTDAVTNLIRENKSHQMGNVMQSGGALGMHTLNMDLRRLTAQNYITRETAFQYTNDRKDLEQYF
ncbi:type IV pilus twitching motility protein PilT [Lacrimispora sp. NSJ-141]|uniref:Type IV pilus twitching motility protein PilT n=1 Tax=Lientehia hominis TaxID=2897778 RepID=A0AAP2RHN4_9FIRM|nr:type IV pilus twitching motility protein PilT [Lientehia hominis]MCD2492419.1 type IV pilus twitching motility protein PilT [Lientehia hominis]